LKVQGEGEESSLYFFIFGGYHPTYRFTLRRSFRITSQQTEKG